MGRVSILIYCGYYDHQTLFGYKENSELEGIGNLERKIK